MKNHTVTVLQVSIPAQYISMEDTYKVITTMNRTAGPIAPRKRARYMAHNTSDMAEGHGHIAESGDSIGRILLYMN